MRRELLRVCASAVLLFVLPLRAADAPKQGTDSAPSVEPADPKRAAWEAAKAALVRGPADVPLLDQATLHLPEGLGFVPRAQALPVMQEMGNQPGADFIGLVFPRSGSGQQWFASLSYIGEGHIKDDEAKDWDKGKLLDNLRQGTESDNAFRKQKGIPAIEVTGWVQPPVYDAGSHRLVWSAGIKEKDAAPTIEDGVNYNTYVLGREGYISLDFITEQDKIDAEKPIAQGLLAAVDFKPGRHYSDFTASTDKMAAYGIAALVGGVALKKLGLFAVAAAFVAKFAKILIVAFLAFVRPLYRKLFGGRAG